MGYLVGRTRLDVLHLVCDLEKLDLVRVSERGIGPHINCRLVPFLLKCVIVEFSNTSHSM